MPDHDLMSEEDGFVVCRCGATFADNSTEEAKARYRVHWRAENRMADEVAAEGLGEARAALARALLKHDPPDDEGYLENWVDAT